MCVKDWLNIEKPKKRKNHENTRENDSGGCPIKKKIRANIFFTKHSKSDIFYIVISKPLECAILFSNNIFDDE